MPGIDDDREAIVRTPGRLPDPVALGVDDRRAGGLRPGSRGPLRNRFRNRPKDRRPAEIPARLVLKTSKSSTLNGPLPVRISRELASSVPVADALDQPARFQVLGSMSNLVSGRSMTRRCGPRSRNHLGSGSPSKGMTMRIAAASPAILKSLAFERRRRTRRPACRKSAATDGHMAHSRSATRAPRPSLAERAAMTASSAAVSRSLRLRRRIPGTRD